MILIGISGKKTSGKTTCAEIIKELFPDKTIIINFGDAVKESLKPIFNFSDEEFLQMNLNAISSSFMNEDEKTRYTKMIMKEKKLN